MKIPNIVSKSFLCPPMILKFFRVEISIVAKISIDFDLLSIVEIQIYTFVLPIIQTNLGKHFGKNGSETCNLQKLLSMMQ